MITGISGSATPSSSTDILVCEVLKGAGIKKPQKKLYRLNEMRILPCQACGKSPEPEYCFFEDDAMMLYEQVNNSKALVFGSPVYFDSVSAQAKIFIDRCNCIRPVDFSLPDGPAFKKSLFTGKQGGIILVGGEKGKFDAALKVMRAFFIWTGIEIKFELFYRTKTFNIGEVKSDKETLASAYEFGKILR